MRVDGVERGRSLSLPPCSTVNCLAQSPDRSVDRHARWKDWSWMRDFVNSPRPAIDALAVRGRFSNRRAVFRPPPRAGARPRCDMGSSKSSPRANELCRDHMRTRTARRALHRFARLFLPRALIARGRGVLAIPLRQDAFSAAARLSADCLRASSAASIDASSLARGKHIGDSAVSVARVWASSRRSSKARFGRARDHCGNHDWRSSRMP